MFQSNKIWVFIGAYVGIIYATIPVIPTLRKSLVERFGYGFYNVVYPVFIFLGLAALIRILRDQKGRERIASLAGLILVANVYAVVLPTLKYDVEKVHFLQYGLLGFLLLGALRSAFQDSLLYLWILVLIYCIGLGDEAIQWLIPNRVGEISDVSLNVYSGFLGVLAGSMCLQEWIPERFFLWGSLRRLLDMGVVAVVLTGLFLWFVHGFGVQIEDSEAGTFYSSFTVEALTSVDERLLEGQEVQKSWLDVYENEGYRHLFQRDFYDTNRFMASDGSFYIDYRKARNENRVLEKFYSTYLDRTEMRWPDSKCRGDPSGDLPWTSRVKSTIITRFTRVQMLVAAVLAIVLMVMGRLGAARMEQKECTGVGVT